MGGIVTDEIDVNKVKISLTVTELRLVIDALCELEDAVNRDLSVLTCDVVTGVEKRIVLDSLFRKWRVVDNDADHFTLSDIKTLSADIFYLADRLLDDLDYHKERLTNVTDDELDTIIDTVLGI